jgi:MYXO-CTERM domain-containing protein
MRTSSCVALIAACSIAGLANANIRITEVMSSSNSAAPTADWIEVTNFGSTAVDLTGWRMDDGSFNVAASVALSGITSIGAGESVIFIESAAGAGVAGFRTFWGGLSGLQVGFYSGSGVGFSSGGDGACLFDGTGSILSQVSFGAATNAFSFFFGWDSAGALDPAYTAVVSSVGTIGTQVTTLGPGGDTGSVGTAIGVPAPGALALLGLAGLVGRRRR